MKGSMIDMLAEDLDCEGLLDCVYGLTDLDRECFRVVARSDGPMTVDEVAEAVDRERSTAYRSMRRLADAGVVQQDQVTFDEGSYCHVYEPVAAEAVTGEMQRVLNDWYAEMGQLLREFEEKFGEEGEAVERVES